MLVNLQDPAGKRPGLLQPPAKGAASALPQCLPEGSSGLGGTRPEFSLDTCIIQ